MDYWFLCCLHKFWNWLHSVNFQLVIDIFIMIGVFLGPYLAIRWQRRHEVRQYHFNEIKTGVFRPLLEKLNHYLLILERKKKNVGLLNEPIPVEGASVSDPPLIWKKKLSIVNVDSQAGFLLNEELSRDAEENHFKDFFVKLEAFVNEFSNYNNGCLALVKELKDRIQEAVRTEIPDMPLIERWDKRGFNIDELALFIFDRKLDLYMAFPQLELKDEPDGTKLQSSSGVPFAKGSRTEMEKCLKIANNQYDSDWVNNNSKDLTRCSNTLKNEAIKIEKEIEQLIWLRKLPGRCDYCRI